MNYTENYDLGLPLVGEQYDVNVFNTNYTIIDAALKNNSDGESAHIRNKQNPHEVTAAQVGLGNVNNTSDVDKPVSTAQAQAISQAVQTETTRAEGAESALSDRIDAISGAMPGIATTSTVGLVKPDGSTITIVSDGTISATQAPIDTELSTTSHNAVRNSVVTTALNGKQDTLTFDSTPTSGSTNPVTSNGIHSELALKANSADLGTAAYKNVPTSGDALNSQVVLGNDSRLSDPRQASDVYAWAKAPTKPTYTASEVGAIPAIQKGAANGVAELDVNGFVPSSQLPSYVDDVLEYNSLSDFPVTGESGKIYIATDTNKTYRWSGSIYSEISASLALGETSSTAYRGDRGKIAYDHSQLTSGNPHNVTKADVGLGNVGNFKAVSTVASQGLTDTEKANARANIGAGTSSLVLGTGSGNAYYGDKGNLAYTHAVTNKGSAFASGLYKITTNSEGHVTAATAVVKADITALGIPGSVPTVNNATLTIQQNGTDVETFTANASTDVTANITVPTKVSQLTNDSGYTTNTGTVTSVKVGSTSYSPSSGVVSLPAYPTVNNATLTIQKNGTNVTTFTANSSSNATANISVPTKTSDLTNDSGFITSSSVGVTSVATGNGLKGGTITSTGTISTNVPRVAKDSKSLPGANSWVLEEYTSGTSYNLPSNHWYYIFSMQGSDTSYGAQLALGMTTNAAYYRVYNSNTWGSWQSIINTVPTVNNGTLTIQKNGTSVQTFTANQSSSVTANITVPTKTSDITNDSGFTSNTGTVTSVATGVGLTGGTITGSGTIKAKLRSETALTNDSVAATETAGRIYPVVPDKSGYLSVNVPWQNSTYTVNNGTLTIQKNGTNVATFTANQSGNSTANITVPTKTSELTNDSSFSTLTLGSTSTTAAAGNHTHATSIAASSGTNQLTLAASTKYAITAGGTSYVFTTPPNTTYSIATSSANGLMSATDKGVFDTMTNIITLPMISYSTLPSQSTDASVYFKEWLAYVVANYKARVRAGKCIVAPVNPNSQGTVIGWFYSADEVDSTTKLPRYTCFIYIPLGNSSPIKFGTNNYTYYYSNVDTNTTYGVVSTSANGLAPKVTDTSKFLKGDGTWATPTNTWTALVGATSAANGSVGYINSTPPKDGYNTKFFRADGTWAVPSGTATVNNGTLTIQKNGTNVQTFTANQSSNATANITVPTKVSELTNDSGFTTLAIGTTASTAAAGNHTHGISIAADSGTNQITLAASTKYKITAGGQSYIFTTPPNSTYTVNNGTLTIQKNGTNVQTFTANQSGNATANITVPTKVSELTNDSGFITTYSNNRRGFWGTSSTAAATAEKAVTLGSTAGWELVAGTIVGVKFTNTNTAGTVKLNVNSSGAKQIWYSGAAYTGTEARITGWAGHTIFYMYDGTYWEFLNNDANYINTNTWTALVGATSSANGSVGYINATPPKDGYNTKYFRADGTWAVPVGTTYTSKAAASGGTDVSLCTTGEKYTWNSKTSNTGTVTKISTGTGLTGGDITTTGTISLASGVVTAGSAGPTAAVTGNEGTTVAIPRITVDTYGRVTALTSYNLTCKNSTYTVNNGTLTINQNGTAKATFTANQSGNSTANIITDSWTSTATVSSSGTVAFSSLDDSYGYDLYCKNKLLTVTGITKSGSGTSTTLTYTVSGAATGDVCKLRILK